MTTRYALIQSPVGELLIAGDDRGLQRLSFVDRELPIDSDWDADPEFFEQEIGQLDEYFAGERTEFDISLNLIGTPFQLDVWQALTKIPYGTTATYGAVAREIGRSRASRAVGQANNRNPIAIIVPCHRVIGCSGDLVGYGGGMNRKLFLLNHEAEPHERSNAAPRRRNYCPLEVS